MLSDQHFQIVLQTVKVARSKPLSSHLLDLKGCIFQALAVVLPNLKGLISTYKGNFPYPCRSFYLTHYGQILLPIPGIFSTPLKGTFFYPQRTFLSFTRIFFSCPTRHFSTTNRHLLLSAKQSKPNLKLVPLKPFI